jgi:hypothetical protein
MCQSVRKHIEGDVRRDGGGNNRRGGPPPGGNGRNGGPPPGGNDGPPPGGNDGGGRRGRPPSRGARNAAPRRSNASARSDRTVPGPGPGRDPDSDDGASHLCSELFFSTANLMFVHFFC